MVTCRLSSCNPECTNADNTRKRVLQYIEKDKERKKSPHRLMHNAFSKRCIFILEDWVYLIMYTFEFIKTFLAQSLVKFWVKRGLTSYAKSTIIMQYVIVVIPYRTHLLLSLLFSLCL